MKMNNQTQTIAELIHSMWIGETPVGAVLMAIFMSVARIAYKGGGWRRMVLEGLLCGALTLTFASAFEYFHLPKTLSVGVGGMVGFIGVDAIRSLAMKFLGKKLGLGND